MTLEISAGRITVTQDVSGGDLIFDTDRRMFAVTDYVTGSVVLPQRVATYSNPSNSPIDVDTSHLLDTVNASATVVTGAFRLSGSTSPWTGLVDLGWFSANGSYAHYQDSLWDTSGAYSKKQMENMAIYTSIATSGNLYLHERVYVSAGNAISGSYSITMPELTFDYKLFVGLVD